MKNLRANKYNQNNSQGKVLSCPQGQALRSQVPCDFFMEVSMCPHKDYEPEFAICELTGEVCPKESWEEEGCEELEPTQTDIAYQERRIAQGEV